MKRSVTLLILLATLAQPSIGGAQWGNVGEGIDYQEVTTSGPNQLFVSRMDRSNPNTTLDTTIANDKMSGSKEIVRSQAAREDDAITWWGQSWGPRNKVVAAINGGFYNTSTGVIDGGQIKSGWYAHWFPDRGAFSGPVWKNDRTMFHGECVDHTPAKVYVKAVATGVNMTIDGINITPSASNLIMFTPQYDTRTPSGTRTEVLVEMSRPNLTTTGSGYSSGIIRSVVQNTGSTWIPFDHLVLSAAGSDGTTLKNNSTVGAEVRIFQELIESNKPDVQGSNACQTNTGRDFSNVFSAINSNYFFLENNVVRVPDAVAHPGYIGYVNLNPRTAICWNSSYVFFVICDGRSAQSIGMSCATLGNWAKSTLGATDGVNLDGGGSSTMLINGTVMNVVSDGSERAVCNGVTMVAVQPMQRSTQFTAGQTVYTTGQANCRLGPGTNFGIITAIAGSAQGTIVNHTIMGVYAKGYYWWKCNFGGTVGWIAESLLTSTLANTPPSINQHPSNQTVLIGGTATFTVSAGGTSPLSYQWQKTNADLNDGGHYAGCTTSVLTISGCDANDAANYRCVVTNAYGTINSNAASLTVNTPTGPTITQHPATQTICIGAEATLTVVATGSGTLTYQWQKNSANLSDAAPFAGVTTPTLTITGATAGEAGNYRCVVTDTYGSSYSNPAALTVIACVVGCLQNPDFEQGFTSGAGTGWTKFVAFGSEGANLAFSDETTEHYAGAHCQEVYSHDVSNEGGVYQRFPATSGQPYKVSAWIKVYSPQGSGIAEGFIGVDPTGGTNPSGAGVLWASKPWETWSQDSFTVSAQSNFVTVFLRGRSTKAASTNKTAYVWLDDAQLLPGAPTDASPQALSPTSIQWRWTDLSIETGYRVRDTGGTDKSGLLAADTAQWTESTGISPNTQYTRRISTVNDCGESDASAGQTAYALSVPPGAGTITPSNSSPALNENVVWTAVGGFGPGTLQYYRYAWDQSAAHTWTGSETQWTAGTLATSPTAPGPWYLHVRSYNGDHVPNGAYDYAVTVAGATIPPDLDHDGDVDQADFDLFIPCLTGAVVPPGSGCDSKDFDLDADVDQSDFGVFQRCYSGENTPVDPTCWP